MKEPVLILSDLHLGHGGSLLDEAKMLEPLLQDCRTLLLNGDTWQQLAHEFKEKGARLWADLQAICHSKNIEIILLPGNHDPDNVDQSFATLADGAIAITHGDCIYAEGAPWSRMAMHLSKEIDDCWRSSPETVEQRIDLGRKIAHLLIPPFISQHRHILLRIWDAITPPGRAFRMVICWWHMICQTRRFSRHYFPQAKVMICGHFHRQGIWDDGKLLVINTGSYMPPGGALWCEWNQGLLRVGKVKITADSCQRHELIGTWRIGSIK